jgi:hypothetical protein
MRIGTLNMTKTELLQRLTDIEWDDFEVKEARLEPKSRDARMLKLLLATKTDKDCY